MKYQKLFQSGKIGGLTIKNRGVMMPMHSSLADSDNTPGERMIAYFEERAKGGIGLIINEAVGVDDVYSNIGCHNYYMTQHYMISNAERLTEAVHKYDCRIFAQLHHGGATANPNFLGHEILGPSAVPAGPGRPVPRAMTIDEIHEIEQKFIDAAVRCQTAGYDGVELHGAHGYLLAEMFSPHYNLRTDEYGGSFENRMRMMKEIIEGIRQACGRRFPISVRISGDEMTPELDNMMDLAYSLRIGKYLESLGIDCMNISNGSAVNGNANCDPYSYQPGWKKHIAAAFKKELSIPVIATNTIKTPDFAEQLLEEGVCDFVGLGRSQFADPEFMNKAKNDRAREIRKCIGCMYCRERVIWKDLPVQCTVNPRLGCEYIYKEPVKDGAGRRIAVIGGGPAGMQAAKTLAERGFQVTLYEKKGHLGGWMNLADKPKFKEIITPLIDTMQLEIEKLGVQMKTGTDASPVRVKQEVNPEAVFLATGAQWTVPPVEGADLPIVCTPEDIVLKHVIPKNSAIVIGCGNTGLECAEMLLDEGVQVTMADMLDEAGRGMYPVILNDLMGRITSRHPEILLSHKLLRVTETGVDLEDMKTGEKKHIDADRVVLSLGSHPIDGMAEQFQKEFDRVVLIGSAEKDGRIHDATKTGFIKAWAYE
ncbi:MAG: NAD(P)/FAD-dependent oxidoreductase [Eubacterium sp.]|jgi:2,4-dienoyl-CoA reductase-like NADH-dependent reductase (Old Yellow Enzyme family)/thioredoxin reductase|nr:NAD(P)/FAD-dependent oxidoreductase [Eubacterium sp.]MCH4046000.1 NAD(P)/FAD-dependent oxidoreductase [Eubacterium sp.]MCH4079094.1 NAD(P)/FAD-dependent oxidoreductase [Eubacterium sp.]MCH4110779.1 NAD(P)/FAD-dependent oxidoreductase [Eubacterium sp.]MCI1306921.1 NAD(P)/FAD-dependent oxidoreductase [Eubacterium sp.]